MKLKVVFSAPTKEALQKMLNDYYYSSNYSIDENLNIINNVKPYSGKLSVRVKGNRWQVILNSK